MFVKNANDQRRSTSDDFSNPENQLLREQ